MAATTLRPVEPIDLPGVIPGGGDEVEINFQMVDPRSLMIDDAYQRGLSSKSIRLISKIVANWDWGKFKPPIVAETPEGRHVIDGQHTAIAAATHPRIGEIPVMLIKIDDVAARASSFVGHNRDRVAMTPVDIFFADVAAGDDLAMTVQQVCDRAGVRILRHPPGKNRSYAPGDTVAITSIKVLCDHHGAMKSRQYLETLVKAGLAPIKQIHIQAVEQLMNVPRFEEAADLEIIGALLRAMGTEIEREAAAFAATHRTTLSRGLASVIFQHRNKGRLLAKRSAVAA